MILYGAFRQLGPNMKIGGVKAENERGVLLALGATIVIQLIGVIIIISSIWSFLKSKKKPKKKAIKEIKYPKKEAKKKTFKEIK